MRWRRGGESNLRLLERCARKGDTVVLMLEPMMLQGIDTDYMLVWQTLGRDLRLWKNLPPEYIPGLFSTALDFYSNKQYIKSNTTQAASGPTPQAESYFADFGPMGDAINQRGCILEKKYLGDDFLAFQPEAISAARIRKINRFCLLMKLRGVNVVYAFTPENELAIVSPAEDILAYQQKVTELLQCPVIFSLENAIYPGELFYNSNRHLNSEGATINTARIVDALQPYFS